MPKVKVKRKSTFIDMTAMSDVTVLLLTFFMLTSTFVQKELAVVAIPSSVSEIKIPETNILQITVDGKGKIFLGFDKQDDRVETLKSMGEQYGVSFTDEEIKKFRLLNAFGAPIQNMKQILALPDEQRDEVMRNAGVPIDSANNQFKEWIRAARQQNRDLRIAIKADQTTPYAQIKDIMGSLQDIRENRYNLITSLKTVSDDM